MEPVQRNTSQQFSASLLQHDFEDAAVDLAVAGGDVEVSEHIFDLTQYPNGIGICCRIVPHDFIGVRVFSIDLESPANGKLQLNDQIVMVDEVPLITAELSDEQALALVDSRLHGNKSFLTIFAARLKPDQELENWEEELKFTTKRATDMMRSYINDTYDDQFRQWLEEDDPGIKQMELDFSYQPAQNAALPTLSEIEEEYAPAPVDVAPQIIVEPVNAPLSISNAVLETENIAHIPENGLREVDSTASLRSWRPEVEAVEVAGGNISEDKSSDAFETPPIISAGGLITARRPQPTLPDMPNADDADDADDADGADDVDDVPLQPLVDEELEFEQQLILGAPPACSTPIRNSASNNSLKSFQLLDPTRIGAFGHVVANGTDMLAEDHRLHEVGSNLSLKSFAIGDAPRSPLEPPQILVDQDKQAISVREVGSAASLKSFDPAAEAPAVQGRHRYKGKEIVDLLEAMNPLNYMASYRVINAPDQVMEADV